MLMSVVYPLNQAIEKGIRVSVFELLVNQKKIMQQVIGEGVSGFSDIFVAFDLYGCDNPNYTVDIVTILIKNKIFVEMFKNSILGPNCFLNLLELGNINLVKALLENAPILVKSLVKNIEAKERAFIAVSRVSYVGKNERLHYINSIKTIFNKYDFTQDLWKKYQRYRMKNCTLL